MSLIRRYRTYVAVGKEMVASLEEADRALAEGRTRPMSEVLSEMADEAITDEVVEELWSAQTRDDIRRTLRRLLTS